jgi:hypothetical protein
MYFRACVVLQAIFMMQHFFQAAVSGDSMKVSPATMFFAVLLFV